MPYAVPPRVLALIAAANVKDARTRFREIYCALSADHASTPCDDVIVRLPDEPPAVGPPVPLRRLHRKLHIAVVPGFLADCFAKIASPFQDALEYLRRSGYTATTIRVSGLSGTEHNARQIHEAIVDMRLPPAERLLLVGHSKGAADILEALVAFPDLVPKVAAVVSVAGVIGGSPLADDLPRLHRALVWLAYQASCAQGDNCGPKSLRRSERRTFLSRHQLPHAIRYVSVGGIPYPDKITRLLRPGYKRLAKIDALNDGQVIWTDTIIPGGVLAGFVRADHWAIAMPFSRSRSALVRQIINHNEFPREILLEALVRMIEEDLE